LWLRAKHGRALPLARPRGGHGHDGVAGAPCHLGHEDLLDARHDASERAARGSPMAVAPRSWCFGSAPGAMA